MAIVSHTAQSFTVDGRRLWLLAASLQYARIDPAEWAARVDDARQAGFNTVETACPWMIHEARKGRYVFQDGADVRRFVEICAAAGMRVILRPGPFIGSGFDGGGLPNWLLEDATAKLREGNEAFLERVSRYFRKLLGEVGDLQATQGGPIILVQVEHEWMSANEAAGERYLGEIARMIRENGVGVPLINANNLWVDANGTIDTWRGDSDLLANGRQLRTVQPTAPRLIRAFEDHALQAWGRPREPLPADTILRRLAEILAAGAQPIVTPFHGGTNFGFLGGRLPGHAGGAVTTSAASGAPLGEAGARGDTYHRVRRLVTFANHFGHVFADLDPDYQPVVLEPEEGNGATPRRAAGHAVVPLRGAGGRIVFVFAGPGSSANARSATLLLDGGLRLPVDLGDQPVGWYVLDVDLHGKGRLDYTNLCPFAIVNRSIVILHGPARTRGLLSVNGTPLEATVPRGEKPLIVVHRGITFLICNQQQIDRTYHDDTSVYVGVAGLDAAGRPLPLPAGAKGTARAWVVTDEGELATLSFTTEDGPRRPARRTSSTIRLGEWRGAETEAYANGTSPRYASLDGPRTLPACGAPTGYGWYRLTFKVGATRKHRIHAPQAGDRLHLYLDGTLRAVLGDGPGAVRGPIDLSLRKGPVTLIALVDNFGRFADGNELDRGVGLWGHLYDVKLKAGAKGKSMKADAVDPFSMRQFILGGSATIKSDVQQAVWAFTHARKTPVLADVENATVRGTFVLNDENIAYYAGESGACGLRLLLDPAATNLKRGKNVLRFAPDAGQVDAAAAMLKAMKIYECVETLTASAQWAFAKWEPLPATRFKPVTAAAAAKLKGAPCWWRTQFKSAGETRAHWFDATGLSKGQAFVNGHNLGRFFTATATGKAVGPQHRLYVPAAYLHADRPNELLVFDEHGFAPHKAKMVVREAGDLD